MTAPINESFRQILARMYVDIDYFAHTLLKDAVYDKTPEFHREIYSALENSSIRKLAVIAPRGHAKSTLATKIYPLHKICFGTVKYIVIISESNDQSVALLQEIKDELEYNNDIKKFFGDLVGKDRWREDDIVTANGIRVWARGSRQRVRGTKFQNHRPDLIILDDFESELNTETPEQRLKLKRWINASVLPAVEPKRGKVFLIGTIVHEDSYLNDIATDRDGKLGWDKLFYKAIKEDGTPLWKERFPLEELERIRQEYAAQGMEHIFYQEYMNESITPGGGLVKQEWIKEANYELLFADNTWWIKEDGVWKNMYVFYSIDPSLGKLGGDLTGEIVLGVTCDNNRYVLEANELRMNSLDLTRRFFEYFKKWKFQQAVIESVIFQEVLKDIIYDAMIKRNTFFPLIEEKPRDRKSKRLEGITPFYASGSIYHNGLFPALNMQLKSFPKSKHDDLLDALWQALKNSYAPPKKEYQPKQAGRGKRFKIHKPKRYNWAVL